MNTNTWAERLIFNYEFEEFLKKRIFKKIGVIANKSQLRQLINGEKVIFKKEEIQNIQEKEYTLTQQEKKVIEVKDKYCKRCGRIIFGNYRRQYCENCKKYHRKLSVRNAVAKLRLNVSNQLSETVGT